MRFLQSPPPLSFCGIKYWIQRTLLEAGLSIGGGITCGGLIGLLFYIDASEFLKKQRIC